MASATGGLTSRVVRTFDRHDQGEIVGHGFLPNGDVHEFMLVPDARGAAALEAIQPQGLKASARPARRTDAGDRRCRPLHLKVAIATLGCARRYEF
jgi:hypothetical protein